MVAGAVLAGQAAVCSAGWKCISTLGGSRCGFGGRGHAWWPLQGAWGGWVGLYIFLALNLSVYLLEKAYFEFL